MATCMLCLNDRKLCKSHIFPEYMYKHSYDGNHSYVVFNAEQNGYNKTRRKGLYEYLLCLECEGIIQKYEDYGKSVLYDKAKPFIEKNKRMFTLERYDYKLLKLFVLSLVWRASISSLDDCKLVSLGPYEAELREVLLCGKDIESNRFPILIDQMYLNDKAANGVFIEMHSGKTIKDNKTIYLFVLDGLLFLVGVGVLTNSTISHGSSISPEKLVIGFDQLPKIESFKGLFLRLSNQGKI